MSYEQLKALSNGYAQYDAEQMLLQMTACQGDGKSWKDQRSLLLKRLNQ